MFYALAVASEGLLPIAPICRFVESGMGLNKLRRHGNGIVEVGKR
jgi:hypothetical protein